MSVEIRRVQNKRDTKRFIKFAWKVYRKDPELNRYWVPPVVADYMKTLDKEKYPLYDHADIALFTAWKNGRMAGTIAAVENRRHNEIHNDKTGFWGFFECINDQDVANALFDAASQWLKTKGLDAMRGPVSPSMNDQCGMLVKGFDSSPVFLMLYNPQYYNNLVTNVGHRTGQELLAWYIDQDLIDIERLSRIARHVMKREQLSIRTINMRDFENEIAIIRDIYNRAWEKNWGFVPMTDKEFAFMAKSMKAVAKEHFIYFVEDKEGKPIGFSLTLPDMNIPLKHVNGNPFTPWGLVKLWWYGRNISAFRTITMGVLPEYRNKGIDSVLNAQISQYGGKYGLYSSEMSWVLKSNEAMSKLAKVIGGIPYKEYVIYEKEI